MSTSSLSEVLQSMWQDYTRLNPQAASIYSALRDRGENVLNDHIALRTIRHPKLGIDQMGRFFEKLGYVKKENYKFAAKKLDAYHYEHSTDATMPKIFISELLLDQFSPGLQTIMNRLVDSIPESAFARPDFIWMGRPWNLTSEEYLKLADESEYASWVAAFGFRPNHFTVAVNFLKTLPTLPAVNEFVKGLGFRLNTSGGEIKGSKSELLEQSSTMADPIDVTFSDRKYPVPSCYYEFALRHPMANGKLYQGFVAASADKIFESTDRK